MTIFTHQPSSFLAKERKNRFLANRAESLGFSLVELLVVIAIMALLIALSAPAFLAIARGQGMKRAVVEVSGIMEEGRIEAMATSTWIWMGIKEQTTEGQSELLVVLVASKDGTKNMAPANLRMIARPVHIKNTRILSSLTNWATNSGTVPLAGSGFSFSEKVKGETVDFSDTVLGFGPRGEAAIDEDSAPSWIEIGLREMRGEVEVPTKTASLRVSGFSGQQEIDY